MEKALAFETIGPVEQAAKQVVERVRMNVNFALTQRVNFRTYKSQVEPTLQKYIADFPDIEKPLRQYLESILLKPLARKQKKSRLIQSLALREGIPIDLENMERQSIVYFDIIIEMLRAQQVATYSEAKENLWKQYLGTNLNIFGNHRLYNIAIDALEKSKKRHLPRKTELYPHKKINNEVEFLAK